MYQFLFRNKWVVLAFVVLGLVFAQALIGRGGGATVIPRPQSQPVVRHQPVQPSASNIVVPGPAGMEQNEGPPPDEAAPQGYADGGELIDPAQGYDPTPSDDGLPPDVGQGEAMPDDAGSPDDAGPPPGLPDQGDQ